MKTRAADQQAGEAACDITELLEPRFFKALCDQSRLEMIIHLLHCGTEQTVSQIAEQSHVDMSVVSRHLAMLRDVGILTSERRGKEVYYRVNTGPLVQTLRMMADALEACCPPRAEAPSSKEVSAPVPDAPRRRQAQIHSRARPVVARPTGESS